VRFERSIEKDSFRCHAEKFVAHVELVSRHQLFVISLDYRLAGNGAQQ
jgi:hypothetical protein